MVRGGSTISSRRMPRWNRVEIDLSVYRQRALTPNASDGAEDRPHVDRIYLLNGGVLELVDQHIDLEQGYRIQDRIIRPVPGVLVACCSLHNKYAASGGT